MTVTVRIATKVGAWRSNTSPLRDVGEIAHALEVVCSSGWVLDAGRPFGRMAG